MAPKERPPPACDADGGPENERLGNRLDKGFNARGAASQASALPRERLACLARKIHGCGERVLFELLVELASGRELGPVLERYGRLAPLAGFIAALNGDQLPTARLVGGRRS
jgi:hypothetical protein